MLPFAPLIYSSVERGHTEAMAEPKETHKKSSRRPTGRSTWLYVGTVAVLVIIVFAFIGMPAIAPTIAPARPVFGRYGSQDIAYDPGNFFARQYEAVAQSLQASGNEIGLELQLRLAWREAFNRAVLHTAILQEAEASGVRVSQERIDGLIARDPRFQVNGRFDAAAYRSVDNQTLLSMRDFYREVAIFEDVVNDVLTGGRTSNAERDFVAAMAGPERSFDVVRFPFSEFPDPQVRLFAAENTELFTTLDLAVVTLATEEEAQQIRSQALEPGNPMGDLARTYSRDLYADQEGQIGEIFGYELRQELVAPEDLTTLLNLREGDISDVVETTGGWSFYSALSAPRVVDPTADDALAEVREYMEIFEQGRIQDYVRAEAERFAETAATGGFAQVALIEGREVVSTPFFPINYGNLQLFGQLQSAELPDLADAAFREDFLEAAFSLEGSEVSEPIVLRQSAVVLQIREEREAREQSVGFITDFYDSLMRQFSEDEIEGAFVDQERLEDNFAQAFNRYVLGN